MNLHLQNKVIIVTGGARGIGEGISRTLAAEGATVAIIDRNKSDAELLVNELSDAGHNVFYTIADLTRPDEVRNAMEQISRQHNRIDGLVNNAGVNDGVNLEHGSYEKFMESLHKNLVHYYLAAHYALSWLIKAKGSIVNISSKTAETGQGGTSAYAAANGGRNALTREWAVELLKYGIRVNSVVVSECYTPLYENWIKTFSNPGEKLKSITSNIPFERRFTTKEEIADMVAFLLSGRSSHTTGQLIHVDGGYVHLDRAIQ